jgi:uncharacterized flavoprotein (TIGR03862 family)
MLEAKSPPQVAIVGTGPAGLMAADVLVRHGTTVTIFERMPTPGRKFLLAGRGGLNLTHSEEHASFLARYGAAAPLLAASLQRFGPAALRAWCAELGVETFVGTSGRVFPTSFKTSPLLRRWLRRLDHSGVRFRFRHLWTGWSEDGALCFETPDGDVKVRPDATILALGGASWPHLGSDGQWADIFQAAGLAVAPLQPANCGFMTPWSPRFRDTFEGQPLKNIALTFEDRVARGDAIVTRAGLEGGPVYALAPFIRDKISAEGEAWIHVSLRPDIAADDLAKRLAKRGAKHSLANALRKQIGLSPIGVGLLREATLGGSGALADLDMEALAHLIKAVPLRLTSPMPLARSISTAGGVRCADPGTGFMVRPGVFVAGEMVDWEAPTGGYLLQACFATGVTAAESLRQWLAGRSATNTDAAQAIDG